MGRHNTIWGLQMLNRHNTIWGFKIPKLCWGELRKYYAISLIFIFPNEVHSIPTITHKNMASDYGEENTHTQND